MVQRNALRRSKNTQYNKNKEIHSDNRREIGKFIREKGKKTGAHLSVYRVCDEGGWHNILCLQGGHYICIYFR